MRAEALAGFHDQPTLTPFRLCTAILYASVIAVGLRAVLKGPLTYRASTRTAADSLSSIRRAPLLPLPVGVTRFAQSAEEQFTQEASTTSSMSQGRGVARPRVICSMSLCSRA